MLKNAVRSMLLFLGIAVLFPAHAQAENTEPFGQWWCTLHSRTSFNCTRFILDAEPPVARSVIVEVGDIDRLFKSPEAEGKGSLLFRETAYLEHHAVKDGVLLYALPGAKDGAQLSFSVESEESATKMYPGGTYTSYSRIPLLDSMVEEADKRTLADPVISYTGTLRNTQGVELSALDAEERSIKALSRNEEGYAHVPSGAIRAWTEIWEADGSKLVTLMSFVSEKGLRYNLELYAHNNELLLTMSDGMGYEEMMQDPVRKKLMNYIMPSRPVFRTTLAEPVTQ
jgi:hypothetical protein